MDAPSKDDHTGATRFQCLKIHEKHMVVYRGESEEYEYCDYDQGSSRAQGMMIYDTYVLSDMDH